MGEQHGSNISSDIECPPPLSSFHRCSPRECSAAPAAAATARVRKDTLLFNTFMPGKCRLDL